MITIKNEQSLISLDKAVIKKDIQELLTSLGYGDFDIGILFISDAGMHQYNKQYRDKDYVTDVLSFPMHHDLRPGKRIKPHNDDEKNLGDIIIAPAFAREGAHELQRTLQDHLRILIVHGICHLLGYDHQTDQEYEQMQAKENELLSVLSKAKNRSS
ncbi:rRNA maturation RNase YbeY [Candidatus Babeliales bacterium]|nr:rRNA maturation RNase YbeY [Candidatus Babeliales bacterium]